MTYLKLILLIAAGAFASRRPEPAEPPPGWVVESDMPDYRRRVRVSLRIERQISPGNFLARASVQGRDVRIRRTWAVLSGPEQETIPVYLTLRGVVLHDGCTVHAWITGRGVPRRLTGGFGEYVMRQGASSTLRLSPKYHAAGIECGEPSLRDRIRLWIEKTIEERIEHDVSRDAARGFVLGSAGYMDRTFRKRAAELGILHVFAASGMHLAILYGILFLPGAVLLGRRHPAAVLFPVPVCFFYLWLLDFPVSLSRAFVFVAVMAFSCLVHRRVSALSLVLNSAIILALLLPREFLTLSSALSFGAVGGIFLCMPVFLNLFHVRTPALRFLWTQLLVTASASVFTTPLLSWFFQGHSYSSLIVNLLAVPLSDLVLPALFGALAMEAVSPDLALPLWKISSAAMTLFCDAAIGASSVSLYAKGGILPAACCLVLFVLVLSAALLRAAGREICGRRLFWFRASLAGLILLGGPAGAGLAKLAEISGSPALLSFTGRLDSDFAEERVFSKLTGDSVADSHEIQNRTNPVGTERSAPAAARTELSD